MSSLTNFTQPKSTQPKNQSVFMRSSSAPPSSVSLSLLINQVPANQVPANQVPANQAKIPQTKACQLLVFLMVVSCFVLGLSVVSLLTAQTAVAATPTMPTTVPTTTSSPLADGGEEREAQISTTPDPFGRETPRGTVLGLLRALTDDEPLLASNYMNLSPADNAPVTVRKFKKALDTGGRLDTDLQISNLPEGNVHDNLPAHRDHVGFIRVEDGQVPLIVERVQTQTASPYWKFSKDTIDAINTQVNTHKMTWVERYTIDALKGKKILNLDLADIMAVVLLVLSCFMVMYVLVWLLYLLVNFVYPRVRNRPLPINGKVILPFSVVLTSLMLTEIMLLAGVSVTVREPVNRFSEILALMAVSWLLLRVIDVVFGSAERISYKRNYVERLAIIGLLRKMAKVLLFIFAAIIIFGNLGFDLTGGIAALGVGGLALALGAQKTVENLVGSLVVVADRPIRVGDYCRFGSLEGTVIDIGIRSTRIRTLTRTIVTVPNGDFSSMMIENYAARDMFRFYHKLFIKRSAEPRILKELIYDLEQFLRNHELTNQEWNQAYLIELRQDCYVIELQAYIHASGIVEFYEKQTTVLLDILNKVAEYDVEHALPTQQLLLNTDHGMSESSPVPKNLPKSTQRKDKK